AGRRDIADIMIMPAIAPGPTARDIQHVEIFAQEQLRDSRGAGLGSAAHHGEGDPAAALLRTGIMGSEDFARELQVCDILPNRIYTPIETDRRPGKAETLRRARPWPGGLAR